MKIILENVINAFLLVSFWIMCAGFCTFFKQEFKIPIIITASINAIITYFLLMKNMDGIIKLNLIVVPIMVVIIIAISIKNYPIINVINNLNTNTQNPGKSILSAILYTSYNSITLIPIIVLLTTNIKNKREESLKKFLKEQQINNEELRFFDLEMYNEDRDLKSKINGIIFRSKFNKNIFS